MLKPLRMLLEVIGALKTPCTGGWMFVLGDDASRIKKSHGASIMTSIRHPLHEFVSRKKVQK